MDGPYEVNLARCGPAMAGLAMWQLDKMRGRVEVPIPALLENAVGVAEWVQDSYRVHGWADRDVQAMRLWLREAKGSQR